LGAGNRPFDYLDRKERRTSVDLGEKKRGAVPRIGQSPLCTFDYYVKNGPTILSLRIAGLASHDRKRDRERKEKQRKKEERVSSARVPA